MTQAAETEEIDNDVEEQGTEQEAEQVETTETEEGSEAAEDEGVVVSIGEESPTSEEAEQERAPEWVRELRKSNREKDREIRELKAQAAAATKAPSATVVGAKPTLEGCGYDADQFESELTQWHQRKKDVEAEEAKKEDAAKAERSAWQAKLDAYGKQKSALKVSDYEDAEAVALESLNVTQRGVILSGADAPATLVYALGKNPKRLKELASISDPVKFAFAVAKLETQLKVTPRKAAPLPETTVRGSARIMSDATLTRLEAEADKSGDRTKVIEYRKKLKQKAT